MFLEAIDSSAPGEVLVDDNGGRVDEACVGDLVALEAKARRASGATRNAGPSMRSRFVVMSATWCVRRGGRRTHVRRLRLGRRLLGRRAGAG